MIEQALYFLLANLVLQSNYCKGAILNIGLGPGLSARAFLLSRYINRVVSCELQQPVIDAYRAKYAANETLETRHTIVLGNAATIPAQQLNPPFDFAYIDVIQDHTDVNYQNIKAIVNRLHQPGALVASTGVVCIEWTADVKIERQARQWMEDNGWAPVIVRPELADNGWGRAAQMLVYRPI